MRKDSQRIIEIPEGIQVEVKDGDVVVKGNGKEIERVLSFPTIDLVVKDNKFIISAKKATKRELKILGTIEAHVKNMIQGINEDFVYKLEICNVHFPMNVKVEQDKVIIKSFLGEKYDRVADIVRGTKVDIKGNEITVSCFDKEAAGQTAANIEKATRLTGRDRRIFQDGIFITEKCGRQI